MAGHREADRAAVRVRPHLDPQLVWAGKAERQSFEVEAPSIHVHERLSADDIIRSVMKERRSRPSSTTRSSTGRKRSISINTRWSWENRLILGDSLVVMTSLLEEERLGGQVQMICIDPPYRDLLQLETSSPESQAARSETGPINA